MNCDYENATKISNACDIMLLRLLVSFFLSIFKKHWLTDDISISQILLSQNLWKYKNDAMFLP